MPRCGNYGVGLRYGDFVDQIDLDAVYEELGWSPERTHLDEDIGFCPDLHARHNNGDTTGKFAFNRNKKCYNCWVCGGGSLLSWVMESKDLDIQDATSWLYDFTKPKKISAEDFYSEIEVLLEVGKPEHKNMPFFNDKVIEKWRNNSHRWFAERRIDPEVASYFKLGFDAEHIKYGPKGNYTGPCIILPHFWKGKLMGWQERWLSQERPPWVGKYTNTSDFPRNETLWGYDFALKSSQQPIIVESVTSALYLISEGYSAIATFGASVSAEKMALLRVFNQGVILAPDNDPAGYAWLNDPGKITLHGYLERYIPTLVVPYVEGSGADLGDLEPDQLSLHLKSTNFLISLA